MKFARYWTRGEGEAVDPGGQRIQVVSRGWSDESVDAARALAAERARRLAQRIATDRGAAGRLYEYGDSPVPEPIVQDLRGAPSPAVITRNSYGALVLNADELMFADVDGDNRRASNPLLDRVRRVVDRHGFSARVYQTAAGYRVMVTDRRIRGGGNEAELLLNEFGSDPLYMRLCRTQESFRARLSPKPWRCGMRKPPVKFPFESPAEQASFERWEAEYNQGTQAFATCRLIDTPGGGAVDAGFRELIDLHDRETKVTSGLPLA